MKISKVETLRLGEFPNLVWVRIHTDAGIIGLDHEAAGIGQRPFLPDFQGLPRVAQIVADKHFARRASASKRAGQCGGNLGWEQLRVRSCVEIQRHGLGMGQ